MKLSGNTSGLKANHIRRLLRLYRRRTDPNQIISRDLARELTQLSSTIRRQIGLLLNRRGAVAYVVIGDHARIMLPDLQRFRVGKSRLRGLRLVHTHLKDEPLSEEDISDMLLLRLDLVAVLKMDSGGLPKSLELAHVHPSQVSESLGKQPAWQRLRSNQQQESGAAYLVSSYTWKQEFPDFTELITSVEEELDRSRATLGGTTHGERTLIVHVYSSRDSFADEMLEEMHMLAKSSGLEVVDTVLQQRNSFDANHFIGRGKLTELAVQAICLGVDILLFSCELSPSQIRQIAKITDLKIVDRTQLILDIFAQRAKSKDGKLQVELAQLRYLLPRLVQKGGAMSRLMGGIGGRGPGETKLEIDRRRVRERTSRLEREIEHLSKLRGRKRSLRHRTGIPVVALVGYTNVGKSTLFNLLSGSNSFTENGAFATLDPTSRRVWLPSGSHAVIMDTVGFVRDLPKELVAAFRATLEEVHEANLILHVIDVAHEDVLYQMESVERLLSVMGFDHVPQIRVLNKIDKISKLEAKLLGKKLDATTISALDKGAIATVTERIDQELFTPASLRKVAPQKST